MMAWTREQNTARIFMTPCLRVATESRKAPVSTVSTLDQGVSLYPTTRAGNASLCFKYDKAQTFGHLAPGCKDELSGLDPANLAAFNQSKAHTEIKGYSGGIGLCLHTRNPTIKTPIGRDSFPGLRSINYAKEPKRTASHARKLRNPEHVIVQPI